MGRDILNEVLSNAPTYMGLSYQSQRQSPEKRIRARARELKHCFRGRGDPCATGLALKGVFEEDLYEEFDDDDLEGANLDEEFS